VLSQGRRGRHGFGPLSVVILDRVDGVWSAIRRVGRVFETRHFGYGSDAPTRSCISCPLSVAKDNGRINVLGYRGIRGGIHNPCGADSPPSLRKGESAVNRDGR